MIRKIYDSDGLDKVGISVWLLEGRLFLLTRKQAPRTLCNRFCCFIRSGETVFESDLGRELLETVFSFRRNAYSTRNLPWRAMSILAFSSFFPSTSAFPLWLFRFC